MHLISYVFKGTANFMACEVEVQRYIFFQEPIEDFPTKRQLFHFNPLHDLESWWWILNWVLHYHVDGNSQTLPPGHNEQFQVCFPGLALAPGKSRVDVLLIQMIAETFPTSFRTTAARLNEMRKTIVKSYEAAEETLPVEYRATSTKLCQFMLTSIQRARKEVGSVALKPSHHVGKHQAEHSTLLTAKRRKEE